MRFALIAFSLICAVQLNAIDTTHVKLGDDLFIRLSDGSNIKAIFFLHGGLINPYFRDSEKVPSLDFLLEGNTRFIGSAIGNGFDVILPVTNEKLNWLTQVDYCFERFEDLLKTSDQVYEEVFISGFSDGGTGSFKIFYSHLNSFAGLIVFNGYPYHNNYAASVDYQVGIGKKVLFLGTKDDKTTPYEFMLATYCEQKALNPNSYLYLAEGKHSFNYYEEDDFAQVFDILTAEKDNHQTIAEHGYIRNDELIEFYTFRKFVLRKYLFGEELYEDNQSQKEALEPE